MKSKNSMLLEDELMSRKKRILVTAAFLVSAALVSALGIYIKANALPAERVIHITAKKFEFSPDAIALKKGEPVVFEISSGDREHGFNLRAFGVRTNVSPG